MRNFVLLSLVLVFIGVTFPSQAQQTVESEKPNETQSEEQAPPKQPKAKIEAVTEQDKTANENPPEESKVERFVMPFTKWVEGKLHSSTMVNPIKKQIAQKKGAKTGQQGSLRAAIKEALAVYPGTVLSAEKSDESGVLRYRIKIISADGVVKIITVPTDEVLNGN